MREIKLRYWNGVTNQMVYEPDIRKDYQFSLNEYINTDRGWVWMQFTGLKDKNGKEIYEGDVVREQIVTMDGKRHDEYIDGEIQWNSYNASFVLVLFNFDSTWSYLRDSDFKYEIIGNIYEHPDLLND